MATKEYNFPYPILFEDSLDYLDSDIQFNVKEASIVDNKLCFAVEYTLLCDGLKEMLDNGLVKAIVLIDSPFASYSQNFEFDKGLNQLVVQIDSNRVVDKVFLTFQIVSKLKIEQLYLKEWDQSIFNVPFEFNKGDVLAFCKTITVKLDASEIGKPLSSIITVIRGGEKVEPLTIDFERSNEKIAVILNEETYDHYYFSKNYNNGTFNKIAQSVLFLSVITEAVAKIKEEMVDDAECEGVFFERLWVKSILARAAKLKISMQDSSESYVSIANKVLDSLLNKAFSTLNSVIENMATNAECIDFGGND
ncbi:hypothetical protein [Chryseobacterium sp.]|uniref:hypothetical protein n=1 Tax=Chryseobacterium sp. TaxID=1871047 RepID=UPI002FC61C1A